VRLPIRTRLTLWYGALLAAVLVAVALFVSLRLESDLVADSDHRLDAAGAEIAHAYRVEGVKDFRDTAHTVLPHGDALAQILDSNARVIAESGGEAAQPPLVSRAALVAARAGARQRVTIDVGQPRTRYRADVRPVDRLGRRFVAVTAESLAPADRSVHRVVILFLIGGPIALLLTAAGGWWLARKALLPVERMTEQADRMGTGSLDRRLEQPRTEDEVARLARTLNSMLDRVERGVEDKQRLIADASHELRTPLTVMRSEIDVALDDPALDGAARAVLASARDEVDRMTRLVADLLVLASMDEGGLELVEEPVDMRALAAAVAHRFEARGPVAVTGDAGAIVLGDSIRLDQALSNLVDNALKFGAGAEVDVEVATRDGEVRVAVTDRGPGIPAADRERVFDRFVRLDAARGRGGSGLGLAICREVAAAHGGRVWAETAAGGGSRFVLALPAARNLMPSRQDPLHRPAAVE
jgi:heavy metal sensor kinase